MWIQHPASTTGETVYRYRFHRDEHRWQYWSAYLHCWMRTVYGYILPDNATLLSYEDTWAEPEED